MSNEKLVEVEQNVWCSWCFEKGTHYLVEQKYLGRNTYRCAVCCNDTKCCTLCGEGMSRSTTDGDDKLCMKCDGTISDWGVYPDFVEQKGRCSWCFKDTTHLLVKYNYIRRSICLCSECKHRTLRCRTCEKAFARGYMSYDDENCYACNNYVPNWNDPAANVALLTKKAWCSWCMSDCDHVTEQINSMRRDVFNCTACDGRTLLCFTCKMAMCRGAGWDDDCCLVCSHKKGVFEKIGHGLFSKHKTSEDADPHLVHAWEELAKKKAEVTAKYDNPDFVRSELQRESEFKKKAIEAGMIRPFLLLVAMTPELRNQVSNFLGWSIFTEKYFGDPHAESWDILSRGGKGMITRSNSIHQKVNPFGKNCTYYELLHRVMGAVFKFVPLPDLGYKEALQASVVSGSDNKSPSSAPNSTTTPSTTSTSTTDAAPDLKSTEPVHLDTKTNAVTTDKEHALNAEDSFMPNSDIRKDEQGHVVEAKESTLAKAKNTLAIAQLEEFLMAQVHAQQRKTMTRAQREQEDRLTKDPQGAFKTAVSLMREKAGLSNKDAIKYGVGVARQVFQVPGKWGLTLMGMQALQTALPTTAVFMGPAIAGLTVLMGPLAIIGLAQLLWSGVNFAIGPTLMSLYGPLVLMTNQRIVLALQDLQVESFY